MKKYIVSFGYTSLAVNDKETALTLLEATPVKKDYTDNNDTIWVPEEKDITVSVIDDSSIRHLSEKEVEDRALKNAESRADWAESQNKDLRKQIEELKCQIKVLISTEKDSTDE